MHGDLRRRGRRPAFVTSAAMDGARTERRPSTFLPGLHAFRAIATVMVVGQHAAWALPWPPDSTARRVLADVLDNSTVLFVFLAGFLFAHLSGRYSYTGFLRRRFTMVVLPYLCVLAPAAVLAVLSPRVGGPFTDVAGEPEVLRLGWFVLHGATMVNIALWFVPMITLYYLLAPVFGAFLRWPGLYWLLALLVPLSLLAHRQAIVPHADILAMALYYLSAYVLGMCASHHRARLELCARYWWVLAGGYVLALVAEIAWDPHHGNYDGAALFTTEHGAVDWIFAQKLLLCLALLATTQRFSDRLRGLRGLGFAGFSVFLVHCYLVNALKLGMAGLHLGGSVPAWLGTTAAALAGSLLLVRAARAVLGPWSPYVIGSASPRPAATG
jgi:surface polysaccharide O-acyltransferase-like enzyme